MATGRAGAASVEERIARLGVLGPIEAWDAQGRSVRITKGQSRVLAVLLEAANEVVAGSAIQEALWADDEPENSRDLLHQNVWTLRNLLGRDVDEGVTPALLRRSDGYELRLDPLEYDWSRHQRLVGAAQRAINSGKHRDAQVYLLDAHRLWRGDALLGLDEPFVEPFASMLEEARSAAMLRLVDAGLALGEHEELVPRLRHVVGKTPENEALARRLMIALFRSGRQADALEVYRRCRRALTETGLAPTEELTEAELGILMHAPSAVAPNPVAPRPPQPALAGVLLAGRWPVRAVGKHALGDAELALMAEDAGGEIVELRLPSFVARFDDVNAAFAAAVGIQNQLAARTTGLGRFVVVDRSWALNLRPGPTSLSDQVLNEAQSGQILLFRATEDARSRRPPDGSELRQLGAHHMRGVDPAVNVFQLIVPEFDASARPFVVNAARATNNLPEPAKLLFGRESLIEEIADELSMCRLVTLTGPGGVGKSTCAIEAARTLVDQYRDGVWVVELEWIRDPGLLAGTVADAMNVEPLRNVAATEALLRHIGTSQVLFVFDTCEHLLAPVRAFADRLLTACPGVSIAATSLQPLGSRHERAVPVPPLAPPAAAQFFCHQLESEVSDAELEHVARVCDLVEGVPLTIVLAAARAKHLGLATMSRELERAFLEGGALTLLDAGGKLRETLEWTFARLERQDDRLLTQLSLFAGTFTLDEAEALWGDAAGGDAAAVLCRLADCSAIVVDRSQGGAARYRLLPPVRAFGATRLRAAPEERSQLSERHAEMYLSIARNADKAFGGPAEGEELRRLDERLGNMRAALAWALASGRGEIASGLTASLWRYWFARGRLEEGLKSTLQALALVTEPTLAGLRSLGGSSYLAWWMGDLDYTRRSSEQTAQWAEAIGDPWGHAWAPLGVVASEMFSPNGLKPEKADLLKAIDWFVRAGHPWEAGQAIQLLAGIDWHRDDIGAAKAGFGRAVELARAAGGVAFMDALQAHGLMLGLQGQVEEGIREIQAGLELADRLGDRVGACHAFLYRAAIARVEHDFEESARLFSLALRVADDTGDAWAMQWALDGLAAWAAPSRPELAARLLGRAEALAEATHIRLAPRERADHARALARVEEALGVGTERALSTGRAMTNDEAVALALGLGA